MTLNQDPIILHPIATTEKGQFPVVSKKGKLVEEEEEILVKAINAIQGFQASKEGPQASKQSVQGLDFAVNQSPGKGGIFTLPMETVGVLNFLVTQLQLLNPIATVLGSLKDRQSQIQ
jgi:hypothetical protein